jgi:phage terminase large subunit
VTIQGDPSSQVEPARTITLAIEPRIQFLPYLERRERWSCIVAHRRAGKTVAVIQDLLMRSTAIRRNKPRFSYIAPTYAQAKLVAWPYLKQFTIDIPGIDIRESDLMVTLPHNGASIRLFGAENYDRLRGTYNDGAVMDEFGDFDPRAWPEVIRPTLADRMGWASFIGTPKGDNQFREIRDEAFRDQHRADRKWLLLELRASQTGILAPEELADARSMMAKEQYAAEFECSFEAGLLGAYYADEIAALERKKQVCPVYHDKAADVFAAFDLGIGDGTAVIVFQQVGQEIHVLAAYENIGADLAHYVEWLRSLPVPIHEIILPHDGDARELQTGNSRREFMEARGFRVRVLPRHGIADRINAVRLKLPRCWFDVEACKGLLKALKNYRSDYDSKRKVLSPKPRHDWASHYADCFGYAVMSLDMIPQNRDYSALYEDQPDWVL